MVDVLDQAESVVCPIPKSEVAQIKTEMIKKLTELAKYYQKTSAKIPSSQSTNVLVIQILQQVEENRDTVTFAIPYNPSFIGQAKKRSKEDGLDIATRVSLDNIYNFAKSVAETIGKKVSFILLYDSALSLGICENDIIKIEDYLNGCQAIHRYIIERNTGLIQIREWDSVGDSLLEYHQKPGFIESGELESAYVTRLKELQRVFREERRASLVDFVTGQIKAMRIETHAAEVEQTYKWLKGTFGMDSIEEARRIALSIELFKGIDAVENNRRIIRLSPHVKNEEEHSKYGFAFFPGSGIMMEPWVGNFVARSGGKFTLDVRRKERSFEEVAELERIEEEIGRRRRQSAQIQQQKEARKKDRQAKASKVEETERLKQKTLQMKEPTSEHARKPIFIVQDILQTGGSHIIDRSGLNGKSAYL
ncbi:MAG: hypothetical protein PHY80_04075 [Rickettsiales bacterium]|nr:hypothetical protein [Rickettsiales bacterium]